MGVLRGDLLRKLRLTAGLTQPQLAVLADISVRALRDMEQGRVTRPHPGSLQRLASALDLDESERLSLIGRSHAVEPDQVSIGVLGPLTVSVRGVRAPIGSVAQQRLIGLLALETDRLVTVEEIADVLWHAQPPHGWRNRIHVHVSQLRKLLQPRRSRQAPDDVIRAHGGAYRLGLSDGTVDASRFVALLTSARKANQEDKVGRALSVYQEALACWRGPVLAGSDGRVSVRPAADALRRERLAAACALADLAGEAGQQDQAVMWLQQIAVEDPLHEGVHSRLIVALAGTGQQSKALRLYRDMRKRLADELGVDPAEETQAAYRAVLGNATVAARVRRDVPKPAQLPMTTSFFAGRDAATARLVDHLRGAPRSAEIPAPRIVVVHGMPGVGKTELALHVAHRIRQSYPDGQLFADLQGEREHPMPVEQVLSSFLRSLGVPAPEIPPDVADRAALLRSSLAGRRLLMVLDDAKTSDQVLPLLPADAGNDVIITSRNPLVELPVTRYLLEPLLTRRWSRQSRSMTTIW
ncbi:MAG TPA: transcriptional regulator, partial [Micromonosporaceae bacterium]|nr:transcriptional regulator [Micromonosporaceae bacterium]